MSLIHTDKVSYFGFINTIWLPATGEINTLNCAAVMSPKPSVTVFLRPRDIYCQGVIQLLQKLPHIYKIDGMIDTMPPYDIVMISAIYGTQGSSLKVNFMTFKSTITL
jgi:hypothetical protein